MDNALLFISTMVLLHRSPQKRVRQFAKRFCNNIKLVFSSFKIDNMVGVKDPNTRGLPTCVVYKFLCAGCNVCYVG